MVEPNSFGSPGSLISTMIQTLSNLIIDSGSDKVCLIENSDTFLPPVSGDLHTNTDNGDTIKPSYSLTKIIFTESINKSSFIEFPYRFYLDVFKKNNKV